MERWVTLDWDKPDGKQSLVATDRLIVYYEGHYYRWIIPETRAYTIREIREALKLPEGRPEGR